MNPAVLLIDMQENYLSQIHVNAKKIIIKSQLRVLNYCAETDVPVVVVEFSSDVDGYETIEELADKCVSVPRTKKVIKCSRDAFNRNSKPDIEEVLKEFKVNYVVAMGIYAGGCVKETVSSALNRGYLIGSAQDLIADHYKLCDTTDLLICDGTLNTFKEMSDFFTTHEQLIDYLEAHR